MLALRVLVVVFALVSFGVTESNLSDALRNITQSRNSTETKEEKEDNTLKSEVQKYLRECGGNTKEENSNEHGNSNQRNGNRNNYDSKNRRNSEDSNNYNRGSFNNRRNNYSSRNCEDNQNSEECDNKRDNNNYNNRQYSKFSGMYHTSYGSYDDDGRRGEFGSTGSRCGGNRRDDGGGFWGTFGSYGGRGGQGRDGYGGGGYRGDDGYYGGRYENKGSGGNQDTTYFRTRRSNYDSQCISQCIFGVLEVVSGMRIDFHRKLLEKIFQLGDDRVPSETLLIKWLQDHLTNDVRRIRSIREARRCFARLSTTDNDDGCEFSKALSSCLGLEIE